MTRRPSTPTPTESHLKGCVECKPGLHCEKGARLLRDGMSLRNSGGTGRTREHTEVRAMYDRRPIVSMKWPEVRKTILAASAARDIEQAVEKERRRKEGLAQERAKQARIRAENARRKAQGIALVDGYVLHHEPRPSPRIMKRAQRRAMERAA